MTKKASRKRILTALSDIYWNIDPQWLDKILSIQSDNLADEIQALETRLGTSFSYEHPTMQLLGDNNIAVITSNGPVFYRAGMLAKMSGAESVTSLAKQFGAAEDDDRVTDIVLNFETSPGGQVAGIVEFAQRIAASNKRVWSYVGDMAASAHYVIASAASQGVYGSRTAQIGNVGVVASVRRSNDDDDNLEIVSSQTPLKRIDPATKEGISRIQTRVDRMADVLFATVGEHLGVEAQTVAAWQGETFIGAQAVEAGAARSLTTYDDLIAEISANGTTRTFSMPKETVETVAVADVTAAWFAEHRPEERPKLFERFKVRTQEQHDEAVTAVLDGERERIKACLVQLDETFAATHGDAFNMIFAGQASAGDVAIKVLHQMRQQELSARQDYDAGNDLPEPVSLDSRRAVKKPRASNDLNAPPDDVDNEMLKGANAAFDAAGGEA